jgi:hypothetical protein
MAPLEKVQSGQPLVIRASDYNAMIEAARDFRRRQQSQSWMPSPPGERVVRIKNNTGANRGRFEVVGLGDPIFDPAVAEEAFKDQLAFMGQTPTIDHEGKFALLLEPIPAGKLGRACLFGVCPTQVIITDEAHAFADIYPGLTAALYGAESGAAQILWRQSGTGLKWAVVRVGSPGGAAPSAGTAAFPAKVISHGVGPAYSVLEQVVSSSGAFTAKSGASNITAVNVAEIGVVSSGSPILNRIVMVTALNAANMSGSIGYTFECPVYARYM